MDGTNRVYRTVDNAAFNLAGWLWPIVLGIVFTPYIVHGLGPDAYGLVVIVGLVAGYLAVLDLGLGSASIKYVSEFHSKGRMDLVHGTIGTTLTVFLVMGLVGAGGIAVLAALFVDRLFTIPAGLLSTTRYVLYVGSGGFLCNMICSVYASAIAAMHRFDIRNKITIVTGTCVILGSVVVVAMGYGAREIVWVHFGSSFLAMLANGFFMRRLLPNVPLWPTYDGRLFKKLATFGVFSLSNRVAGRLLFQIDQFLIAMMLGPAALTLYAIPARLAQRIHGFASRIALTLFPLTSELLARQEKDKLYQLYIRASRLTLCAIMPVATTLAVLSSKILLFWLGADFAANSALPMTLLAIAVFIYSFAVFPYLVLEGGGRPKVNAMYSMLVGIVNTILCLALIPRLGLYGAGLSRLLVMILVPLFTISAERIILGLRSIKHWATMFARPLVAGVIHAAILGAVGFWIKSGLALIALLAFSVPLYVGIVFVVGAVPKEDRSVILQYLRRRLGMTSRFHKTENADS